VRVVVATTRELRSITDGKAETDRLDARALARLLVSGLLATPHTAAADQPPRACRFLSGEIVALDREIARLALDWPQVLRLMTVTGVNVRTAARQRLERRWTGEGGCRRDTGARISEASKDKAARQAP